MKLLNTTRPAAPLTDPIVGSSFPELADDLDEVAWLSGDIADRVRGRQRAMIRVHRHLDGDSVDVVEGHMRGVVVACEEIRRVATERSLDTRARHRSLASLAWLTRERATLADRVRVLAGIAAATIVASEWQSPSFAHSARPAAGTLVGAVVPHVDDYRRDRHPEASAFEDAYLREHVGVRPGPGYRALATGSGMAAVTTVVAYLGRIGALRGDVVVGASAYHENRDVLSAAVPKDRLVVVPDGHPRGPVGAVEAVRPTVVMLDTLANAPGVAVADVAAIVDAIERCSPRAILVLDNTGRSCTFRPFDVVAGRARAIVLESLTKFAQFGLDRVTAGVIVAASEDAAALDVVREHLGTNIPDASVAALPTPDRARLHRRLARIGRNATILARRLAEAAGDTSVVVGVEHPSLDASAMAWLGTSFPGGWLNLRFSPDRDTVEEHRRFVDAAIGETRRRGVPLIAGASFGFDVTRIYPIASSATAARPFLRISPGIEHLADIERVADALVAAVRRR